MVGDTVRSVEETPRRNALPHRMKANAAAALLATASSSARARKDDPSGVRPLQKLLKEKEEHTDDDLDDPRGPNFAVKSYSAGGGNSPERSAKGSRNSAPGFWDAVSL